MAMKNRIEVVRGDITKQHVDVIVNAANSTLLGGGGVDGAIHRAAGPRLLEECRKLGGCATGEAKLTGAYELPAKYVVHTVGPVWRGGEHGEAGFLASCYRNALKLARGRRCSSLAFPAISCGVYGYPLDQAAGVSLAAVRDDLSRHDEPALVRWVLFDPAAYGTWLQAISEHGAQAT
jgi:O-acetyl-ADP-ribose deacetylase (regulator of RNase III)